MIPVVEPGSRKEIIYEKAAGLFRDKGYLSTSMRDLAREVGLEPSSLYSHIRSKEEILRKICFDVAEQYISGILAIIKHDHPPHQKIEELIALHVRIAVEDPTSITVFNDEWRHLSEPWLSDFLKLRKAYEKHFVFILKAGIEAGSLKQIEPELAMQTMLAGMRWLHWHHNELALGNIRHYTKHLTTLFLHGMLNKG